MPDAMRGEASECHFLLAFRNGFLYMRQPKNVNVSSGDTPSGDTPNHTPGKSTYQKPEILRRSQNPALQVADSLRVEQR